MFISKDTKGIWMSFCPVHEYSIEIIISLTYSERPKQIIYNQSVAFIRVVPITPSRLEE